MKWRISIQKYPTMVNLELKMADRNDPEVVNWAQFFPQEDGKLGAF